MRWNFSQHEWNALEIKTYFTWRRVFGCELFVQLFTRFRNAFTLKTFLSVLVHLMLLTSSLCFFWLWLILSDHFLGSCDLATAIINDNCRQDGGKQLSVKDVPLPLGLAWTSQLPIILLGGNNAYWPSSSTDGADCWDDNERKRMSVIHIITIYRAAQTINYAITKLFIESAPSGDLWLALCRYEEREDSPDRHV